VQYLLNAFEVLIFEAQLNMLIGKQGDEVSDHAGT
jgi:hypothetical protein